MFLSQLKIFIVVILTTLNLVEHVVTHNWKPYKHQMQNLHQPSPFAGFYGNNPKPFFQPVMAMPQAYYNAPQGFTVLSPIRIEPNGVPNLQKGFLSSNTRTKPQEQVFDLPVPKETNPFQSSQQNDESQQHVQNSNPFLSSEQHDETQQDVENNNPVLTSQQHGKPRKNVKNINMFVFSQQNGNTQQHIQNINPFPSSYLNSQYQPIGNNQQQPQLQSTKPVDQTIPNRQSPNSQYQPIGNNQQQPQLQTTKPVHQTKPIAKQSPIPTQTYAPNL